MAIVMTEGGSIRDRKGSARLSRRQTPHLAVPTTAGSGSEVSQHIVVKDERGREKMHFVDERIIPDAALLDPSVTLDLPAPLTAATGMDALTHAIEAYTAANKNPIADGLALQAMRLIARHLPLAVATPGDKVARGQMLIAAHIAGLAFNSTGVGLVHAMAHVVGARHGVHHGTANAICLPHVIRFNAAALGGSYRDVAEALGIDARDLGDDMAGEAAAQAVAQLAARIKLPARLRDVGVPEGDLDGCAAASLADGALVSSGKQVTEKNLVLGVYRHAY
jgi:alcohol dehydrogenase